MSRETPIAELSEGLRQSGFNAFGVLARDCYDALVPRAWQAGSLLPGARAVLVLATGGPAFFRAFERARAAGDPRFQPGARDPLDAFASDRLAEAAQLWSREGFETRAFCHGERRGTPPAYADFVALGRACGLGTPSRLGLLLHPEFGPWMAIRGLLVTTRPLPASAAIAGPGPCHGCPAPCTAVCPVAAPGVSGFDALRCRRERGRSGDCRTRCGARHACIVGQEYAYAADAEAHHMLAALELPIGFR